MHATSARSKDPNTKVGAVIVDQDNKIVGMGYNGFPPGVKDYEKRWNGLDEDGTKTKYKYVVHAEMNAIFNSFKPVSGCKVYIPFWPCSDCAKHMAAAGISEIIIEDTEYYNKPLTRQILIEAGITVRDVKKNYIISKDATWCISCGVTRAVVTNSLGQSQCRKCGGY
jgi:dCMP deaminase